MRVCISNQWKTEGRVWPKTNIQSRARKQQRKEKTSKEELSSGGTEYFILPQGKVIHRIFVYF